MIHPGILLFVAGILIKFKVQADFREPIGTSQAKRNRMPMAAATIPPATTNEKGFPSGKPR